MTVVSYIFGVVSASLALIVVLEMLRRRQLRERHAIWWFIAGVLALTAGVFPATLDWAASLIGIEVPINLVFFVSIAILFLVCLQHSSELTRLESKTRTLAERVALMELRLIEAHETMLQTETTAPTTKPVPTTEAGPATKTPPKKKASSSTSKRSGAK